MKDSKDHPQAYDCTNIEVISSQGAVLIRHMQWWFLNYLLFPPGLDMGRSGETEGFGSITGLKHKLKVQCLLNTETVFSKTEESNMHLPLNQC